MTLGGFAPALGALRQRLATMEALPLGLQRNLVVAFIFLGVLGLVYRSVDDPRGLIRRFSASYVARLDEQQRWMFLPQTGATLGWLQAALITVMLILYGILGTKFFLGVSALIAVVPPTLVAFGVSQRRARIDEQANGFCLALSNSLKATSSIGDALKATCDVTASPLKEEIETVLRQVRVGATIQEALLALSARVGSPHLDVVVSALLIGRQTGGDLPRILEGTAGSLRELKRLEQMTDTTVRSAKLSLLGSAAMVLVMFVVLTQMFPQMMDPFLQSTKGQLYLAQLSAVYFFALYLGYKFTRKSV